MADPVGISVAPLGAGTTVWTEPPPWQRLDTSYRVRSWSVDRGRQSDVGATSTGTATVQIVDGAGNFDPTNPAGVMVGLGPLAHAAVCLQNPVTDAWKTLFRGYVSRVVWEPFQDEQTANVTLDLVDALALFAAAEMKPGDFGHDFVDGNIVFNADPDLQAVKTRIGKVLDQLGWPGALRSIFTANVALQKTVYAPRSSVLQVMQEAADAEFPDVANLFIGGPRNPGSVVFHGRLARFDPTNDDYDLQTWQVGDDAAEAADHNVVRVSPPLVASRDDTAIYSSALATPQNIDDGDIEAQYVEDAAAVTQFGLRTWSAENLATDGGLGTDALQETHLFAEYIRDNFTTAPVRVGQLTIKSRRASGTNLGALWNMLCNVDLSDVVHLKTTHGGGGGFDTDFLVEGIHYQARPGGLLPYIELTLDVSPLGYYAHSPFPA